jgi:hypothetical protein
VWLAIALVIAFAGIARADDLEALTKDAPRCDTTRATCIGLRVHIAVGDEGPVATAGWIAAQLAGANQHFTALDTGFQITSVDALPASATRVEDRRERNQLGKKIPGTAIHVFVTGHLDDIDIAGAMAYGVTWRSGGKKFIILSTQAWERTLAHELGHVFGLPHSTYPISIMNKTPRTEPPVEQRTFADEEIAKMRPRLRALLRARVLANLRAR